MPKHSGSANYTLSGLPTNASFASLAVTGTMWEDWSAPAIAGVNDQAGVGTWFLSSGGTHLSSNVNNDIILIPIVFRTGSVVASFRIKYQGAGANDGIAYRIVSRDETATGTSWGLVTGSNGTDTNTSVDVHTKTLSSSLTLDFNLSYAIELKAVVATSGVSVYSVGIQTTKRVL